MSWKFDNHSPIYVQIAQRIRADIISGKLKPDEKLTSVRDLADEAGANPNTIQRALASLEQEGFVYSQRTSGRYVTDNQDLIAKSRQMLAQEQLDNFTNKMKHLGYTESDLVPILTQYLKGDSDDRSTR